MTAAVYMRGFLEHEYAFSFRQLSSSSAENVLDSKAVQGD